MHGGAAAPPRSSPRRWHMLPPWAPLDGTACPLGRTASASSLRVGAQPRPLQPTRGGATASPRSSPRRWHMLPPWAPLDATACPFGRIAGASNLRVGAQSRPRAHHPGAVACCHPGLYWMLRRAHPGVPLGFSNRHAVVQPRPSLITQALAQAAALGSIGCYGGPRWAFRWCILRTRGCAAATPR